ncbi:hypothetical protein NB689_001984 [Xanthomonas sacchari]|nr:hypothetical protein [Xanthomonas sacchari]
MPVRHPRAAGRFGVRSPLKNGSSTNPSAPGAVAASKASPCPVLMPNRRAMVSVATVQFMVQISGNQPPLEEQNAAQRASGSTTGRSA